MQSLSLTTFMVFEKITMIKFLCHVGWLAGWLFSQLVRPTLINIWAHIFSCEFKIKQTNKQKTVKKKKKRPLACGFVNYDLEIWSMSLKVA